MAESVVGINRQKAKMLAKKRIAFPWVIKPSDGSGCKGISILKKIDDFDIAFNRALAFSRNKRVLIEAYLRGKVVGVESLIADGSTRVLMIADKKIKKTSSFVTTGLNMPSDINNKTRYIIYDLIDKIHHCLGLDIGPTHIDVIINKGVPRVIDIGPRLAGGPLVYELIPKISGIDYMELVIRQALGDTVRMPNVKHKCFGASRFFISKKSGVIKKIVFPRCSAKFSRYLYKSAGDLCCLAEHNTDRIGCVTMLGNTYEDTVFKIDRFIEKIKTTVF